MTRDMESSAFGAFSNAIPPARRAWVQAAAAALSQFGLPHSVGFALIVTSRAGSAGIRQNVLAEEVGVNPGAMVRILDQAEAADLLERRDAADDRRAKLVHLRPGGAALAAKMEVALGRLRSGLLEGVPIDQLETATAVLRLFEERIGAYLQQERARR